MVEAFGAYAVYYESKERRSSKGRQTDAPGRRGVYVGRSKVISGGHRIIPIEWNEESRMWSLGSVIDRAYAEVNNTKFPLRTVPSEGTDPADFEAFVDRASPKAVKPKVYVVDKVLGCRTKATLHVRIVQAQGCL